MSFFDLGVHLASPSSLRSVLLPVQKKRTKEKDHPDDASARSHKTLKI